MSMNNEALLLRNFFLDLFDHLVDPYLNLFLSFVPAPFALLTLLPVGHLFFALDTPSVPLVDKTFPVSDEFGADVRFLRRVFLLKHSGIFPEVTADLTLLFFCQERAWARSPKDLLESIKDVLLEFLSLEIPDCVPVLEL